MTCNCIKEVEDKILELQPLKGKHILKAKLPVILQFSKGTMLTRLGIQMEATIAGRKAPMKIDMAYAFCPFCGKPAMLDEG